MSTDQNIPTTAPASRPPQSPAGPEEALRQPEEALRQSEDRYQTLFETMTQGVVYQDAGGVITSANPAAERLLGLTLDQMQGRTSIDPRWHALNEDGSPMPGENHPPMRALRTGHPTRDVVQGIYHPVLAETRWILVNSVPQFHLGESRPYQVYSIFDDVTERKRAQDAMRESERRYRTLVETVPQLVWITGRQGEIEFFNRRWYEYTGLSLEQAAIQGWQGLLLPEDTPRARAAWEEALVTGRPYQIDYRIRRADGAFRWFLTQGVPLTSTNGEIVRWFGTCTDIHERKQAELTQTFLADLGERMRQAAVPETVLWEAVTVLGEFLQTARCGYGEIDQEADRITVHRDYCRGVASMAGTYARGVFGGAIMRDLSAGRTVTITDTRTDPRTAAYYEESYAPLGIRASINVPIMSRGVQIATLAVQQSESARAWTPAEVGLVETVAERTHLAVENARLQRALQQETLRQRRFLQDVLSSVTEGRLILCHDAEDLPAPLTPFADKLVLNRAGGLRELRRGAQDAALAAGLPEARGHDLVTAVGEAGMNTIVHVGEGVGQVFLDQAGGTVQVRIIDHGAGISLENLPNAALRKGFTTAGTMGHGMKIMLQTADRVYLLTGTSGTTVVIEQHRDAPPSLW